MLFPRRYIGAAALLLAASSWAHAAISDFETVPAFLQTDPMQVLELDGLRFSATSFYGVQSGLVSTNNPGSYLVYYADAGSLSLQRADGGAFSLASFDFGPSDNIASADDLVVTGYSASGPLISTLVGFAGPYSSVSVGGASLLGFDNLTRVVFGSLSGNDGYVWLDNIVITAVPEPMPAMMFMAGMGVMSVVSRRARQTLG